MAHNYARYNHSPAFAYPSSRMETAGGMGKGPDEDILAAFAACFLTIGIVAMIFAYVLGIAA